MEAWSHLKGCSLLEMLSFQARGNMRPSGETSLGSILRKRVESEHASILTDVPFPPRCGLASFPAFTHHLCLGTPPLSVYQNQPSEGHLFLVFIPEYDCQAVVPSLMDLHFKMCISLGKQSLLKEESTNR